MINVLELTIDQLKAAFAELGQPAFRATQVADWVYRKGAVDAEAMTNLPPMLRSELTVCDSRVAARTDSTDGTVKLLLELADTQRIECVMIPTDNRATACVSTQVGCAMGCKFCASGQLGVTRNLTSGEILQQVLHLAQVAGTRISHVVFMGMGEPLANYEATLAAIRALNDPLRFNISARNITVSTVGIPKAIRRLAGEDLPITLSISLHAPNDALRRELIPTAERYTIDELIAAAELLFKARGREITLEYLLLGGVNDTNVCAEALAQIAHRLRCSVNLIRYNPVPDLPYRRPATAVVQAFAQRLTKRGVNVHTRRSRGLDADAACGQLRRRLEQQQIAEKEEEKQKE